MQTPWCGISNLTPRFYDVPKVKAGQHFIKLLITEMQGTQERRWNSEHLIMFIGTVLTKNPGIKNFKDIRARLLRRMEH